MVSMYKRPRGSCARVAQALSAQNLLRSGEPVCSLTKQARRGLGLCVELQLKHLIGMQNCTDDARMQKKRTKLR